MAKADLGTKRQCSHCGAKFYDLNKDPILCPRCGTRFEAPPVVTSRSRPAAAPRVVPEPVAEEEEPAAVAEGVEFVPLEEVEAGEDATPGEDDVDVEVEVEDDEEEDTFLEEDEDEEGDDVNDIIGDVDEEER